MVTDTCEKDKCPFWMLTGNNERPCPMCVKVSYVPPPTAPGQAYLVYDCSPIRSLLMLQELSNRLVAVQSSQEQLRNETVWVQIVAEVLGRNSGIDLSSFVAERSRRLKIEKMKEFALPQEGETGKEDA